MAPWTAADIPPLEGRVIIVTGANSGLGFETALALARAGARVVLACRDRVKGAGAHERLRAEVPGADVEVAPLDLADLASVRTFAAEFSAGHDRLDVLVNNAGVMAIPRRETADGFEMQFGTNHLGHFALTGLLLDRLLATPGARVVTVTSMAARGGRIRFDDLQGRGHYGRWSAYGQAKLANQLFTLELDRKVAGRTRRSGQRGRPSRLRRHQPPDGRAADERVRSVGADEPAREHRLRPECGRRGPAQPLRGHRPRGPGRAVLRPRPPLRDARQSEAGAVPQSGPDPGTARRLWEVSEELTGVRYPIPDRRP